MAGGVNVKPPITMEVPAHLWTSWIFGGGRSSCTDAGVQAFDVKAWISSGTKPLRETQVGCNAPENPEAYRGVLDPERRIDGRDFREVSV